MKYLREIYKFRKYKWLDTFLSKPQLPITSRLELNDPYDYMPFTSDVEQEMSEYPLNFEAHEHEQHIIDNHLNGIGVISFTESIDNILMWSHYADGHKGVAIGFDPTHDFFQDIERVRYTYQRPNLREDFQNMIGTELFFKSDQWSYEKEWRLVKSFIHADEVYDKNLKKPVEGKGVPIPCVTPYTALLNVPTDAITSLTLGYRINESEVEAIKDKIQNSVSLSHLKIKKVNLNLNKYELIFT